MTVVLGHRGLSNLTIENLAKLAKLDRKVLDNLALRDGYEFASSPDASISLAEKLLSNITRLSHNLRGFSDSNITPYAHLEEEYLSINLSLDILKEIYLNVTSDDFFSQLRLNSFAQILIDLSSESLRAKVLELLPQDSLEFIAYDAASVLLNPSYKQIVGGSDDYRYQLNNSIRTLCDTYTKVSPECRKFLDLACKSLLGRLSAILENDYRHIDETTTWIGRNKRGDADALLENAFISLEISQDSFEVNQVKRILASAKIYLSLGDLDRKEIEFSINAFNSLVVPLGIKREGETLEDLCSAATQAATSINEDSNFKIDWANHARTIQSAISGERANTHTLPRFLDIKSRVESLLEST